MYIIISSVLVSSCSVKDNAPAPGNAWFDFNDSRVHPIWPQAIEKQFSGKESAYMLFYRKSTLTRPQEGMGHLCTLSYYVRNY